MRFIQLIGSTRNRVISAQGKIKATLDHGYHGDPLEWTLRSPRETVSIVIRARGTIPMEIVRPWRDICRWKGKKRRRRRRRQPRRYQLKPGFELSLPAAKACLKPRRASSRFVHRAPSRVHRSTHAPIHDPRDLTIELRVSSIDTVFCIYI